ncbi:MAG: hypothetical protein KTR24_16395 [Saprospiraceae bacterium]|nr:hypothetical protein [Saprospiraceae bacterium]
MTCQNRIYTWLLVATMISLLTLTLNAQNCADINAAVLPNDSISVTYGEFYRVTPFTADVVVKNQWGGTVFSANGVADTDALELYACPLIGKTLKVELRVTGGGACHSELTVKLDGGPVVMGRTDTLWCTDPAVTSHEAWEALVGTPTAIVPCRPAEAAEFVADWIEPNDTCDQDVAKIIYREYAAYDKDGNRGSAFDTITVFRMPTITEMNAECPEVDTMYCGITAFPRMDGDDVAGYYTGPRLYKYNPETMTCDTLWFVYVEDDNGDGWFSEDEFKLTNDFDGTKCGVVFKRKVHKFEDDCSPVYKVDLEIKQLCAGAAGDPTCDISVSPLE